jgi:hypothetical protein
MENAKPLRIALFAWLLSPQALFAAADSTVFIRGGLSSIGFESDAPSARLKTERGGGLHLSGGLRLASGLAVRADLVGSEHDGGTLCAAGGCGSFDDDLDFGEGRLVVLYAPTLSDAVSLEIGGGIESFSAEAPSLGFESAAAGLVVESALVFLRGKTFRFRLGLALMSLEDDDADQRLSGGEFSAGFVKTFGSIDLGAMFRGLHLQGDGAGSPETDVGEVRLTLGTTWDL